jgi:CBS domain-containing protein
MSHFAMPVSLFMTEAVKAVHPTDDLSRVQAELGPASFSAVAVVDEQAHLVGVVSRSDLLKHGRRQAGTRSGAHVLVLPRKSVHEVMEHDVVTVTPDTPVAEAGKLMLKHRVHRLFVEEGGRLAGVLSTKDLMTAVREKRVTDPIESFMSHPVFTVSFDDSLALAVERLEKAHVSGLIVVEDDWPIGVFTQVQALEARDLPRDTLVEEVLSPAMLCLDVSTPLHRAAEQAAAMGARRIIAVRDRKVEGILTGLDFARVVSR